MSESEPSEENNARNDRNSFLYTLLTPIHHRTSKISKWTD